MATKGTAKTRTKSKPAHFSFFSVVFYPTLFMVLAAYVAFLYDPQAFESFTNRYSKLQPITIFFQMVEKYSPFHEFLNDVSLEKDSGKKSRNAEKVFSVLELKEYDGSLEGKGPYLAVLGQVFDVSKGVAHYGPGGGYAFFSGRDGSRAFVTGEFNDKGLVDDVTGLSYGDYLGLQDWLEFYHKDYKYVGKVEGKFFGPDGKETEYSKQVKKWIGEASRDKEKKNQENEIFPNCNSEWSRKKGHRVWCTKKSGGVTRQWVGRPRRLFYPGRKERCACIKDTGPPSMDSGAVDSDIGDLANPHIKEYEGCDPNAASCQVKPGEPDDDA